jgi:hypothetical protein
MPAMRTMRTLRGGSYHQIIGTTWGRWTLLALAAWLVGSLLLIQWDPTFIVSAMSAASFLVAALLDRLRSALRKQRGDRR